MIEESCSGVDRSVGRLSARPESVQRSVQSRFHLALQRPRALPLRCPLAPAAACARVCCGGRSKKPCHLQRFVIGSSTKGLQAARRACDRIAVSAPTPTSAARGCPLQCPQARSGERRLFPPQKRAPIFFSYPRTWLRLLCVMLQVSIRFNRAEAECGGFGA